MPILLQDRFGDGDGNNDGDGDDNNDGDGMAIMMEMDGFMTNTSLSSTAMATLREINSIAISLVTLAYFMKPSTLA